MSNKLSISTVELSPLQKFVFYRTYSRWQDSLSRRETWEEAVQRYFDFFQKKFSAKVPAKVFKKAQKNVLEMGTMPSMRAFWTAGPALEASHVAGYNCSYLSFKDLRSPVELFYILMCGTGVGFSIENEFTSQNPSVERQTGDGRGIHVVGDSKEGWANALDAGLQAWFGGKDIEFDFSLVRKRGSRLKTMGGRASGPDPLRELLGFVKTTVLSAQGRKLKSIEWLDIGNKIAEVVVVGGVRRSSEITFSDLDDSDIRDAKVFSKGAFPIHRYMSNNSAVYFGRPDAVTFMKEWTALAASGAGERGIFNANNATNFAPRRFGVVDAQGKWSREPWFPTDKRPLRTNPCVPGETEILTESGYQRIDSLVGVPVRVWNGFEWSSVVPRITGIRQPLVKVTLSDGKSLSCTPSHLWVLSDGERVEARALNDGDRLLKAAMPVVHGSDNSQVSTTATPGVVPFGLSVNARLSWFADLLARPGVILNDEAQVHSFDRKFLLNTQKMLTTLGTQSKVCEGIRGDWRLCIGAVQMQELLSLGLKTERLDFTKFSPNRDASRFVTVVDVQQLEGEHTVYCFTEPLRHLGTFEGIVTGQCGEILLRDSEFCNLSEVVVRKGDTFSTLSDKVKSAVWLGAMQSCLTDFEYLRPEFKLNCDEERLLGVSLTGQLDNPKLLTEERLSDLKHVAIEECKKAAMALEINMSAAITTGKPSGTVSQLVDAASGAHPRFAKFYVRRVRISATDPLCKMLKAQGVQMSPENGQGPEKTILERGKLVLMGRTPEEAAILIPEWSPSQVDTWVVPFPERAPEGALTRDDMTAIDQLEWYRKVRTNWCEHNQSMTVYVRDEEWMKVGDWVFTNFDLISGVSFLPYDGGGYKQAPYTECTKEEYTELKKSFPVIDYTQLTSFEMEDNTTGAQSYACTASGCELP